MGQMDDAVNNLSSVSEQSSEELEKDDPNWTTINLKTLERNHKCYFEGCDKAFTKPGRLEWHIRQHTGEKPYKCTFDGCDKAYTTSSHLKRHSKIHAAIQITLVCDICRLTLKTREGLARHYKRVHSNQNRLFCKECGILFRKKFKFEEHMSLHNNRFFPCDKCSKTFGSVKRLEKHQLVHEKLHVCTQEDCNHYFNRYLDLRLHQKLCHAKEFFCDVCSKNFRRKDVFERHLRGHQPGPVRCTFEGCNKTYAFQRNLNQHIRAKHELHRYYCDECGIGFLHKSSLLRHIQKLHGPNGQKPRKRPKVGKDRKRRKDAGASKRSVVSKLIGVKLPAEAEKIIINRTTEIQDVNESFQSEKSKSDVEPAK